MSPTIEPVPPDPDRTREQLLAQALEAFLAYKAKADPEPQDEFLVQHKELRSLLEPMLAGQWGDTLVAAPPKEGGPVDTRFIPPQQGQEHVPTTLLGGVSSHTSGDEPVQIGPYRILDKIGEGGMGSVYKAEQREPVRRLVALKVIKLGMDSKEVLARFEMERRTLAAMNHSSIARVLDVGTTERGQPYFVMELAEGMPLTDYCDELRLTLADRIDLFCQVCAGVQHAHQKGVIHRDLKPGNIMVVREGDRPLAKILDFGLAKATDRDLLAHSIYTELGQGSRDPADLDATTGL